MTGCDGESCGNIDNDNHNNNGYTINSLNLVLNKIYTWAGSCRWVTKLNRCKNLVLINNITKSPPVHTHTVPKINEMENAKIKISNHVHQE